jgi:hypothetical protein
MCRLSWNLEASNFWNPQGQSRAVMGLLYLFIFTALFSSLEVQFFLNSFTSYCIGPRYEDSSGIEVFHFVILFSFSMIVYSIELKSLYLYISASIFYTGILLDTVIIMPELFFFDRIRMLHYRGVILHASYHICVIISILEMQWPDRSVDSLYSCHCYIDTYFIPLKVASAIVTIGQSLSNLRTVKMILGSSRLFLVYLPAISQALWHCAWIFLFVYLVSSTDTVNGLRFDIRYHRGSLLSLGFWSGGDKPW